MNKISKGEIGKFLAWLPYILLIMSLLALSSLTILRTMNLCDISIRGSQVIISPSPFYGIGILLLAFTVVLTGWLLRQISFKNYEKLIILGLLIPMYPFILSSNRIIVHPDYVLIEKGLRFSPQTQKLDLREIGGVTVAFKEVPGGKGEGNYFFTWKDKTGKTESLPMNAEMTTALPSILAMMELHKIPYLSN